MPKCMYIYIYCSSTRKTSEYSGNFLPLRTEQFLLTHSDFGLKIPALAYIYTWTLFSLIIFAFFRKMNDAMDLFLCCEWWLLPFFQRKVVFLAVLSINTAQRWLIHFAGGRVRADTRTGYIRRRRAHWQMHFIFRIIWCQRRMGSATAKNQLNEYPTDYTIFAL